MECSYGKGNFFKGLGQWKTFYVRNGVAEGKMKRCETNKEEHVLSIKLYFLIALCF
jgi:hypothetical protein